MSRSLDIVIVNWNSGPQLRRCLDSIQMSKRDVVELTGVVVVDNASIDGSADGLHFPNLPLALVRNARNLGFAAACNQGGKNSRADYLLFLNPDTILAPESLSTPIEFMQRRENSKIGVCGIQLVDETGKVIRSCRRLPRPAHFYTHILGLNRLFPTLVHNSAMTEWDHDQSRPVEQVIGAFFLVRRNIFEVQGGFDERFFVYFEEVDFLETARREGWLCYFLASAQAYHRGGGCSEQAKAMRMFYSLRSRLLYSYKHFAWTPATGILLSTMLIEPFTRLALAALQGSGSAMRETMQAYLMLWKSLPSLLGLTKALKASPQC